MTLPQSMTVLSVNKKRLSRSLRSVLLVLTAAALLLVAPGCAETPRSESDAKPLIGISICSLLVERWYKDREALDAEFSRLGADVIIQNANNDPKLQASQIDELLDKNIDALIVIPVDYTYLTDQLARADRENVSVLAYERLIENAHIDAYYSFDNVRVGELLALGLIDGMGSGNIILINGDTGDYNTVLYKEGYMRILEPYIKDGRINIVSEVYAENWETEAAYAAVEELLASDVKIDGIIATNDSLAGAAIQVLQEGGITGSITVVGQDGDLAAYQRIVEGVQYATVYKAYDLLAEKAALAAYRMAIGRPFAFSDTINNGYGDILYYKVSSQLVTGKNIDEVVIDGGVYPHEQVYMNVIE